MSSTKFLLLAQFEKASVPLAEIAGPYLGMSVRKAMEHFNAGTLPIPAFRLRESQKAPVLVSIEDLATYIDERRHQAAEKIAGERDEARKTLATMGL